MKLSPSPSRSVRRAPVALALSLVATSAFASDGRYRDFVIGERAGGMGGAALATASDIDAIFYNPAGLSRSHGDSLSLSANLYGIEHYRTEKGLDWGADSKSSSFVSVPAAMGGVNRLSDEWACGFGVFTPKMEKRHLISSSPDRTGFSHHDYNDQTLRIGPAVAWSPADSRFSFGAGVYAIYRDFSTTESLFERGYYTMSGAMDLQMLGALAAFGVQADLGDGWRAGVAVETPTARIWDDGTLSLNATVSGDSDSDVGLYTTNVRADNHIPWQLAAGVGKEGDNWGVSLDAIWHPSTHYDLARWNFNGERATQTMHMRSVFDVSVGGEYVVAERYPIRAGFYTAMSGVRVPRNSSEEMEFVTSDVDMYGVTFSIGRRTERMSVNLGLDLAYGSGHDLDESFDGGDVVDSDRGVFLVTVSTTYYL